MSRRLEKSVTVLGRAIAVNLYQTEEGIQVLLEGGDRGHIGAVAIAAPGMEMQTVTFPGHKEQVICERWARVLCQKLQVPVVVEAGIHYDQISGEQIQEILRAVEAELGKAQDWFAFPGKVRR